MPLSLFQSVFSNSFFFPPLLLSNRPLLEEVIFFLFFVFVRFLALARKKYSTCSEFTVLTCILP